MKWFKHDSDASNDAKLKKLRLKYGAQGYGIYWYCLELIARNVEKHNLTFELEHDAELIADDFKLSADLVQHIMSYMVELELFENTCGIISCLKMANRTDEYTQKLLLNMKKSSNIVGIVSGESPIKSELREENRIEENRREQTNPTASGAICLALKKHQILDVNPSHPKLLALIEAGASIEEFEGAAAEVSVKKFAYVMATVEGRRKDAKNLKLVKGKIEPKENLAWRNDDNQIFKKAKELGIATQGKGRFELLAKIDEKREQSKI